MSELIVCGGPHHGQAVEDVGKVWTPLVMMQDPNNPLAPPVAMPTSYIKRWAAGKSADGTVTRRAAYCHESIQNPEQMMHALASVLVTVWLTEGGETVTEEETPNPRPVSKLILPGQ